MLDQEENSNCMYDGKDNRSEENEGGLAAEAFLGIWNLEIGHYFFKMNKWQLHEIGLFINTDVIWFDFLMLKLVILLAVSIYIYSLLSKIDVASLTDTCLHICIYIYIYIYI